jgi:uridylate kinase
MQYRWVEEANRLAEQTTSHPMNDDPSGPKRILLKLSGEALLGEQPCGIDPQLLDRLALDIAGCVADGAQIALVIGGGNIFRGAALAKRGMDRVTGDHIGMLATVMNALAMQDALHRQGLEAKVLSALPIGAVCEPFNHRAARAHLDAGRVVLFAAGTGNPFFTTDTAAALRAVEIQADLMVKATMVDGVYSADPKTDPDAQHYPRLSYERALRERLGVMDLTAILLCRDNELPLRVMSIFQPGALRRVAAGEDIGSLVEPGTET